MVNVPWLLPSKVMLLPPGMVKTPLLVVVSVPPWIVTPFTNWMVEVAPFTWMVPLWLLIAEPFSASVPPVLASSRPWLVNPLGISNREPGETLALIVPWLITDKLFQPITPTHWRVLSTLVSVWLPIC